MADGGGPADDEQQTRASRVDGVTGVVLCGGKGRRMQPPDAPSGETVVEKGLTLAAGRPMVVAVLDRLAPQVDSILINANRRLDRYRAFGHPVVTDEWVDAGPLAGLLAAMAACRTRWLATVPCDAPSLPLDLVARLRATASGAGAAFAHCGGRAQPVFALVDVALRPELERYLRAGGRRLETWFASIRAVPVEFDDPRGFANINSRSDLDAFEARTA